MALGQRALLIVFALALPFVGSAAFARDKIAKKTETAAQLAAEKPDAPDSALAREARDYLLHGNAKAAIRLFEQAALGRGVPSAKGILPPPDESPLTTSHWTQGEATLLAQAWMVDGHYADARLLLDKYLKNKELETRLLTTVDQLLRMVGSAQERVKWLTTAVQAKPRNPQLTVLLGKALYETGKDSLARKVLDGLADRFEADEFKDLDDLVAVAESLQLNGYVRDANRIFEQASQGVQDDAERAVIELRWGQLLVSKYNYRDGDKALRKVLVINPHDQDAQVAMARIDILSDHNLAAARSRLDKLLKQNPRHLDALALRAEVGLHDEDYVSAGTYLDRIAQQRADFAPGLQVRAAWCKLTENEACFAAAVAAHKKLNPVNGRAHLVAAEYLEINHRYREAQDLLQNALQFQSDLWQAHAQLGMGFARIADDKNAQKHLEQAYAGDPFDVRTANQLSVLYDGVLKQMQLLPGEKADLRVHRKDKKAFERTMLPFIQQAVTTLNAKYAFEAQRPLQIEIFPETEQFSVRTVGLPQLGAHAVCFGHLITSRSPSEAPFNWKMVLWHELSHVYHIQASDGRVPRWLTEGLAMMESLWANPRWRLQFDRRAYDRLLAGQMAKLAKFNLAFSQARTMQDIMDAYYQAMLLSQYLNDRYGFDKLRQLVAAYKTGKTTAQLVQQLFATEPAQIDADFAVWLRGELSRFDKDFRPNMAMVANAMGLPIGQAEADTPTDAADETAEDQEQPAAKPPEPAAPVEHSTAVLDAKQMRAVQKEVIELLRSGQSHKATTLLEKTFAAMPKTPPADAAQLNDYCTLRYWQFDFALGAGRRPAAAEHAQALVSAAGARCDGVRQRLVLSSKSRADGDFANAVAHLLAARRIDASDGSVAAILYDLIEQLSVAIENGKPPQWLNKLAPSGKSSDLRDMLAQIAQVEITDIKAAKLLAKMAWKAWQSGEEAEKTAANNHLQLAATILEETDPASRLSVLFEARAAVSRGKPETSLPAYRLAAERAQTAAERAEAWCELADVAAKANARDDAAEATRHCVADRPPEVPKLEKEVPRHLPKAAESLPSK